MATIAVEGAESHKGFRKVLQGFDMTLFTVCAILVIETLAPSASIGPSAISWWIITLVLFFVPYGLIIAELGATYPQEGGIYLWVKRAFGDHWSARITWLYWVNVALGMPSVFLVFAGMFSQLFGLNLGLWAQIGIGIGMTWVTVMIGTLSLQTSKWIPNIGAFLKALILLSIGFGALVYASHHGSANDLSLHNLLPTWNAGLFFLPVIVYNFMGLELMSGAAGEMKNPGRDIPRAIIIAGLLIAFFYVLGTFGILIAIPLGQIGLIGGIIDTLRAIFGESPYGSVVVTLLGVAGLGTLLAHTVTWTMGANRTVAEAARHGQMPSIFGKLHPVNKTPVNAFLITGAVSTTVIVLYGLMANRPDELFWTMFSFSSIVFLLPYLALFPAFLKLRHADPNQERPYKVPGGNTLAAIITVVCMFFIFQAILFFVYVPGKAFDWDAHKWIIIGLLLTLTIGEVLLWIARRQKGKPETE